MKGILLIINLKKCKKNIYLLFGKMIFIIEMILIIIPLKFYLEI